MSRELIPLLQKARMVLDLSSQGALGEALGSSARTGQRWEQGQSDMGLPDIHKLIVMVHPRDPDLAAQLAQVGRTTLLAAGIAPPPPPAPMVAAPPAPAAPPPPDPAYLVDTVVCAAAEAMDVMPEGIRPALRAAFRRARLARLSVEDIDSALNPGGG